MLSGVLLLALAAPAAADFAEGWAAYAAADFETAHQLWKPLAVAGDANAQFNLGAMYHKGQGVPQSDDQAAWWYRVAAEQGQRDAQLQLGGLYVQGRSVPWDYVQALVWYTLAERAGSAEAGLLRERLAGAVSAEQIDEAARLAGAWQPQPPAVVEPPPEPTYRYDYTVVREVQRHLSALGYDVGAIDGAVGPRTRQAIREYEAARGMPSTGRPTKEFLERLQGKQGGSGGSRTTAAEPPDGD